jgi:hypothetical protein
MPAQGLHRCIRFCRGPCDSPEASDPSSAHGTSRSLAICSIVAVGRRHRGGERRERDRDGTDAKLATVFAGQSPSSS